jgi:hypothetical protein
LLVFPSTSVFFSTLVFLVFVVLGFSYRPRAAFALLMTFLAC